MAVRGRIYAKQCSLRYPVLMVKEVMVQDESHR